MQTAEKIAAKNRLYVDYSTQFVGSVSLLSDTPQSEAPFKVPTGAALCLSLSAIAEGVGENKFPLSYSLSVQAASALRTATRRT